MKNIKGATQIDNSFDAVVEEIERIHDGDIVERKVKMMRHKSYRSLMTRIEAESEQMQAALNLV